MSTDAAGKSTGATSAFMVPAVKKVVSDVFDEVHATDVAKKQKAHDDAVVASASEGRRLYIGNLAYATTEGELKDFFQGYAV